MALSAKRNNVKPMIWIVSFIVMVMLGLITALAFERRWSLELTTLDGSHYSIVRFDDFRMVILISRRMLSMLNDVLNGFAKSFEALLAFSTGIDTAISGPSTFGLTVLFLKFSIVAFELITLSIFLPCHGCFTGFLPFQIGSFSTRLTIGLQAFPFSAGSVELTIILFFVAFRTAFHVISLKGASPNPARLSRSHGESGLACWGNDKRALPFSDLDTCSIT